VPPFWEAHIVPLEVWAIWTSSRCLEQKPSCHHTRPEVQACVIFVWKICILKWKWI